MLKDYFAINYPPVFQGTEKTQVYFYSKKSALFNSIQEQKQKHIYVTDENLFKLNDLQNFLLNQQKNGHVVIVLKSGEENKNLDAVMSIIKTALANGLNRNSVFTGIGGGVITDMTAFAASIYKRGARLELIPTSLLAMVDAACGGKTGCDFDSYKNMIGTFYPAAKLIVCPQFIETLPEKEYSSGLAEAFKTAMLYNSDLFDLFENQSEKILSRDSMAVKKIIITCLKAKAAVVEKDLTEKGPRMELNLGHTFGHALETTGGLGNLPHGYGVAYGIGKAISLSCKLGLCNEEYKTKVLNILKAYKWPLTSDVEPEKLLEAMHKDKKNTSENIRLILQKGLCNTVITEIKDDLILQILSE